MDTSVQISEEDIENLQRIRDKKKIILLNKSDKATEESGFEQSALKEYISEETPVISTLSSVSRIPAVSTILSVIPSIVTDSSNVSLVVPAMSVTIALSSPKRAFKKEDFPAFGLPTIQVRIPSAIILPLS